MSLISKIIIFVKKQIVDITTYGSPELLRKFYLLIKAFFIIPFYVIAIVPCVIIRLVSPWFIIRILRLPAENFGDFVQFTAMFYCKKKLNIDQPKKKHLDLVYIHYKDKVFNKQLAKMWKRKLNFLSGYLLHPISVLIKLIPGWKIHSLEYLYNQRVRNIDDLLAECQPLEFTVKEEIYGQDKLKEFGLKNKDKFVCLDVRDNTYQLKKIPARYRNWSYHDYRHTDINKFLLAAEELTKRGYYIFRMGVIAEKPFISNNPKIIDYANSDLRSDFMDIYLGAKCSFCITTATGFQDLPCLFRKPMAQLCVPVGHLFTYKERFILITKHHILKKEKRRLSLSEIFSHGLAYTHDTKIFEQKGIELVENTQEEIKDLAVEMVENLEFKKKLSTEDEELQKTFRSLYASNIKRYNFQKETKNPTIIHDQIRSSFSTKFLRENKNWLR